MVNICCATYKRYDCLRKMILSAMSGSKKPDNIFIVDNGGSLNISDLSFPNIKIYRPPYNIGLAASWNYFLTHVDDIKLFVNDDVYFENNSIETMVNAFDENCVIYPTGMKQINSFSCMIIPNNVFNVVGPFDVNISPHYAYFEDNDYAYRMKLRGINLVGITDCNVDHTGSATIKSYSKQEESEHHSKFKLAERNFSMKWGNSPGRERYKFPYDDHGYIYREK